MFECFHPRKRERREQRQRRKQWLWGSQDPAEVSFNTTDTLGRSTATLRSKEPPRKAVTCNNPIHLCCSSSLLSSQQHYKSSPLHFQESSTQVAQPEHPSGVWQTRQCHCDWSHPTHTYSVFSTSTKHLTSCNFLFSPINYLVLP